MRFWVFPYENVPANTTYKISHSAKVKQTFPSESTTKLSTNEWNQNRSWRDTHKMSTNKTGFFLLWCPLGPHALQCWECWSMENTGQKSEYETEIVSEWDHMNFMVHESKVMGHKGWMRYLPCSRYPNKKCIWKWYEARTNHANRNSLSETNFSW